ncbi:hypothetical protein [Nostoc sp. UHCC 0870]
MLISQVILQQARFTTSSTEKFYYQPLTKIENTNFSAIATIIL